MIQTASMTRGWLDEQPMNLSPDELRVLRDGPSGETDYPTVQRLSDRGLTDSLLSTSRRKANFGAVIQVAWTGPNAAGRLVLAEQHANNRVDSHESVDAEHPEKRPGEHQPKLRRRARQYLAKTVTGILDTSLNRIGVGLILAAAAAAAKLIIG